MDTNTHEFSRSDFEQLSNQDTKESHAMTQWLKSPVDAKKAVYGAIWCNLPQFGAIRLEAFIGLFAYSAYFAVHQSPLFPLSRFSAFRFFWSRLDSVWFASVSPWLTFLAVFWCVLLCLAVRPNLMNCTKSYTQLRNRHVTHLWGARCSHRFNASPFNGSTLERLSSGPSVRFKITDLPYVKNQSNIAPKL